MGEGRIDFRILGPLEAAANGTPLRLGGERQRALLALLLLQPNEPVSTTRLIDSLWGEHPPRDAEHALHASVSRLRRSLGSTRLRRVGHGYLVVVEPGELDLDRFDTLVAEARQAVPAGEPARAAALLREALALWRGAPLTNVASGGFAVRESERLEELRLSALEARVEADLALGKHGEVVAELEALVEEHPLRESFRRQLMLALYGSGRQADALDAYRDARRTLDEELGIEPGPALKELERRILNQDATLVPARVQPDAGRLPGGTVTLLFTDLEAPAPLLERDGDAHADLVREHRRLLRRVLQAHRGREVEAPPDTVVAAFTSAKDAALAAADLQRAAAAQPWLRAADVAVRVGIHTGHPHPLEHGYVGIHVHRAACILRAAHGGQVLLSEATRALVAGDLPEGLDARDLGRHRLKDLSEPQRLFQLVIPGVPGEFPPLRTLENRATNLPVQPTPFLGRGAELGHVTRLLGREDVRLVTLTGPGGVGKTRLALQAAADLLERFPHGVFVVPLAQIGDPELVLSAIAQALGVVEGGGRSLHERLAAYLGENTVLLVLDNFEQLLGAAPTLAELLRTGPRHKLLVTSRAPLRLSGEHEYPVPSLTLPDDSSADVSRFEAVALFVERARAVRPDFQLTSANSGAVAEICRRLDGLPLALELAAARLKLLPPEALLERLGKRLALLTRGARDLPARQQTLRRTIDWSYGLLGADEQRLFARLSVFVGGFMLEAAEEVCNPDGELDLLEGVASLVDNSLLRQREQPDGSARFSMLQTIREYALERLETGPEAEAMKTRHLRFFCELSLAAAPRLHDSLAQAWLERLGREQGNLREALAFGLARSGEDALPIAVVLAEALEAGGALTEASYVADQALGATAGGRSSWAAELLSLAAGHAEELGDRDPEPLLEEAVALAEQLGDRRRAGRALARLGGVHANRLEFDAAETEAGRGLAALRAEGDADGVAEALGVLAYNARNRGELERAVTLAEEAVAAARAAGDEQHVALRLKGLAQVLWYVDLAHARGVVEEAIAMARELGAGHTLASALVQLGLIALDEGDVETAERAAAEGLAIWREEGAAGRVPGALVLAAEVASARGDSTRALALHCDGLSELSRLRETYGVLACLRGAARVLAYGDGPAEAARIFAAHARVTEQLGLALPAACRTSVELATDAVRSKLGDAFQPLWAEGARMTLAEAVRSCASVASAGSAGDHDSLARVER